MSHLNDQLRHSLNFHLSNEELLSKIKQELEKEQHLKKVNTIKYEQSKELKLTPETFLKSKLFNQ